jgi:hypothetical protein
MGMAAAPEDLIGEEPAGAYHPLAWLLAWRERRSAGDCCRELLKLHEAVRAREPRLAGRALYRQIVALRLGDAAAADHVLERAEDSFAVWPVSRALNFRDVTHYLAVSEFIASHAGARWMHADIRRVVDSTIPHHL